MYNSKMSQTLIVETTKVAKKINFFLPLVPLRYQAMHARTPSIHTGTWDSMTTRVLTPRLSHGRTQNTTISITSSSITAISVTPDAFLNSGSRVSDTLNNKVTYCSSMIVLVALIQAAMYGCLLLRVKSHRIMMAGNSGIKNAVVFSSLPVTRSGRFK